MSIRTILTLLFSIGLSAASVYVYTLLDPRLEIILLKNEEIMRLDNQIADLMDTNKEVSDQVSSISTAIKSNEKDSGKINDEYKICLRQTKRLKTTTRRLNSEISVLQNKNKIMQDYVKINNDVTSLKEQIASLKNKKVELTEQLGNNNDMNLDIEGDVAPHIASPDHADETETQNTQETLETIQ